MEIKCIAGHKFVSDCDDYNYNDFMKAYMQILEYDNGKNPSTVGALILANHLAEEDCRGNFTPMLEGRARGYGGSINHHTLMLIKDTSAPVSFSL